MYRISWVEFGTRILSSELQSIYDGSADRTFCTGKHQMIVLGEIEQLGEFRFTPVIWNIFVQAAKASPGKLVHAMT